MRISHKKAIQFRKSFWKTLHHLPYYYRCLRLQGAIRTTNLATVSFLRGLAQAQVLLTCDVTAHRRSATIYKPH